MMKYLLSNPKAALIFVAGTMASVALLVGSEDDEGLLSQAVSDVETQQAEFRQELNDRSVRGGPPAIGERIDVSGPQPIERFSEYDAEGSSVLSDQGLIDDASGFDPVPSLPLPDEPLGEDPSPDTDDRPVGNDGGEVIIVLERGRIAETPDM